MLHDTVGCISCLEYTEYTEYNRDPFKDIMLNVLTVAVRLRVY